LIHLLESCPTPLGESHFNELEAMDIRKDELLAQNEGRFGIHRKLLAEERCAGLQ
jgi:hypothetical protein